MPQERENHPPVRVFAPDSAMWKIVRHRSILLHGLPAAAHHVVEHALNALAAPGTLMHGIGSTLVDGLTGLLAGALCLLAFMAGKRMLASFKR